MQVGSVTVVASPARRGLAVLLAERAESPLTWPGLGRRRPPPFTLVLADDSASMARLTRGRAPGWGAGVAFPGARAVILRADLPDLERTLRHELAHLVLHDAVRGRLPLWFEEGYAVYGAGEFDRSDALALNLAVVAGRVPSLQELDAMLRGSATSADLAYALAASALEEIARRPAPGGLTPLLDRLAAGEDFRAALLGATGLDEDRFEETWRLGLRRRYNLLTWIVTGGMWAILALSLGALAWERRRRDAPRREALNVGWEVAPEPPEGGGEASGTPTVPVDQRPPTE
ncbi:MAG: hypothetical protein IPF77_05125 [Gemmatimonadetes bacterium]|nr:hypothetical protein [Gemmatimonadota bacterium]